MKVKYIKSKSSSLKPAAVKIVASEFLKIQREQSVVTAHNVLERASDPKSHLHRYFEWKDGIAAHRYRLWQARQLIAQVYAVDVTRPDQQPIRAFVNIKPETDDDFIQGQGYVAAASLVDRPNFQQQVLAYAKSQLIQWRRRFGHIQEFYKIVKEIDGLK